MNKIVQILMNRDDITEQEAEELINDAREAMEDCDYDPTECELILQQDLGLEPDYLFDIIL